MLFLHERNKQQLSPEACTSYYLRYEGKCLKVVFNICLCVCVPCEVDDGEGWGDGVISGTAVVSDGVIVGAILTANYDVDKDALHDVHKMYSQFPLAGIGQKMNLKIKKKSPPT